MGPMEKEKMTIASIDGNTITLNDTLQFTHLGSEYSLEDGSRSWNISAEVGLLSRNIRIIGQSYPEIGEEQFGARVLVSKFTQEGTEYRGYAKISNVEFVRGGQEGWTDAFDPRYALAFLNHEDSIDNDEYNKESYVKKCAFNYNYNAALGLFNTNNVLVEDNVVFRTMEYGIRDEGIGNRFIHNLVVLTRFVGIHKDHRQNFYKRGCFYFKESLDPEFRDNAAAGCERAGFAGTGHICTSNKRWSNNVIHTTQDGIFTNTFSPPVEVRDDKECVVFRGFFVYKAYDYAFYLLTHDTVEMEDNIIVDSGVGIHPFLISPRPTTHELVYKHLRINNTLFVGRNDPAQFSVVLEFLLASHGSTENQNLSLFLQVRFISMTIPLPISILDNVVDSLILPSEPTQEEMTCNFQSLPQEPSLSMLLTAAKSGWTDQSSNLYLTSIVLTCTAMV